MPVFSQAAILIRRFLYRMPRIKTDIPMDFIRGDAVMLGVCLDISESGLRGTFAEPVAAGSEGILTLYRNNRSFQVHACIESNEDDDSRIRFDFVSDQERDSIRQLLKILSPPPSPR